MFSFPFFFENFPSMMKIPKEIYLPNKTICYNLLRNKSFRTSKIDEVNELYNTLTTFSNKNSK